MLGEMGTVGVGMAVMVTVVWLVATFVADAIIKRKAAAAVMEA
ncbi:MAG: hypothetical protein Q4D34_01235 [Eggerthellaceae bacterium]|nr:hypothetical protein [Eggerthellaceae bacterium]